MLHTLVVADRIVFSGTGATPRFPCVFVSLACPITDPLHVPGIMMPLHATPHIALSHNLLASGVQSVMMCGAVVPARLIAAGWSYVVAAVSLVLGWY